MRNWITASLLAVATTASLAGALRAAAPADDPKAARATVVTVTATDFAFQAPDTIAAGRTTLRLVNKGPEHHHIWLIKLEQGKTLKDLVEATKTPGPLPKWAVDVGGPNTPEPGGEASATLDLEAGSYVMACVIPSRDGQPHFMKGMFKGLTVAPRRGVQQAGKTAAPATDVVMTLDDYDFRLSSPITSATKSIKFVNVAEQTHEAVILKLDPGTTAQDFLQAIEKPQGPPPGALVGGVTGIAKGRTVEMPTTFTPGEYALICFVPDAKDGKPHIAHGMVKQFSVK
ncbi:MAG TPA: hypothetical protein VFS59_01020 [Gemmatimonadaceae bacterium]|nr:hypothetical protein [Gemmatimonadaceae bacterium]